MIAQNGQKIEHMRDQKKMLVKIAYFQLCSKHRKVKTPNKTRTTQLIINMSQLAFSFY